MNYQSDWSRLSGIYTVIAFSLFDQFFPSHKTLLRIEPQYWWHRGYSYIMLIFPSLESIKISPCCLWRQSNRYIHIKSIRRGPMKIWNKVKIVLLHWNKNLGQSIDEKKQDKNRMMTVVKLLKHGDIMLILMMMMMITSIMGHIYY